MFVYSISYLFLSIDVEMWTWKHLLNYPVSYERVDGALSLQHQLAISFRWCCDGAGLSPGLVPRRLIFPRPVSHLPIAAAPNSAG